MLQVLVVQKAFISKVRIVKDNTLLMYNLYHWGKKNNIIHFASHLVLHKTKHHRSIALTAETVNAQPTTGFTIG